MNRMANDITSINAGEIVLYQPDDNIKLEVRINNDTVWLTRQQMATLFGRDVKTIGKHINNALREELAVSVVAKNAPTAPIVVTKNAAVQSINPVVAKIATTASDGKVYQTEHYSLDMIISVGYRVHSPQGVLFRRWATNVLREYLLQGYAVNHQLIALQQHVDDRLLRIEDRLKQNEEQVAFLVQTHQQPTYQLYDNGCVFDAWTYISSLIREATNRIILIDNYVDDRVLAIMQKRRDKVSCTIHTRYTEQFQTDLKKHNEQYSPILYVQLPHRKHDRYLIIDETVYMLGDSLKNMGTSLTAIIRTEMTPEEILAKLD